MNAAFTVSVLVVLDAACNYNINAWVKAANTVSVLVVLDAACNRDTTTE